MSPRRPAPGDIEQALERAYDVQAQIERKERSVRRRTAGVAGTLAMVIGPGGYDHRWRIGIHVFDVAGTTCLAAAYLEKDGDDYRYRYAVLNGGEAAVRALRTAELDPSDSDEPGARRVALASYQDCDDLLYRLPMYINDVTHALEVRLERADQDDVRLRDGRRQLRALARRVERDGASVPTRAR